MLEPPPSRRPGAWLATVLIVLYGAFLAGSVYFGWVFYTTVKDVVAYANLSYSGTAPDLPTPSLPESEVLAPSESPPQANSVGQPWGPLGETEPLPRWESKGRVNILLLGIDRRQCESPPWRSDTMIVATLDPQAKTAGLLSIPRDLWVDIPGFKPNRINTAHFLGDGYKYPGGGPALAKKTVERNLGIPIHYFVRIDFQGARKIIDTLGGVTIDVEKPIVDDRYPDDTCGTISIEIPTGVQHMDGVRALQYARSRHGSSDFDRARRQQKLLFAIRDKALSLNLLPKLPQLLITMGDTVDTDLSPREILALAPIAAQISKEDIRRAVIDESMTVRWVTPGGADVLIPKREEIGKLLEDFFTPAQSQEPPSTAWPARLVAENARIVVQDGTPREMAEGTALYLREQGFNVTGFGKADRANYPETLIIDYTGKTYTTEFLAQSLGVPERNIVHASEASLGVDVRIILGADFLLPANQ